MSVNCVDSGRDVERGLESHGLRLQRPAYLFMGLGVAILVGVVASRQLYAVSDGTGEA